MTAAEFYRLVLALWGEDWRPQLRKCLKRHGMSYTSRQTFWNWQHGKTEVPEQVAHALKHEQKARKQQRRKEST